MNKNHIEEIEEELNFAKSLHPFWPNDIIYAAAVVSEETGEVVKACLEAKYENGDLNEIRKEVIQLITVSYRFLENFDKKNYKLQPEF